MREKVAGKSQFYVAPFKAKSNANSIQQNNLVSGLIIPVGIKPAILPSLWLRTQPTMPARLTQELASWPKTNKVALVYPRHAKKEPKTHAQQRGRLKIRIVGGKVISARFSHVA